MSLTRGAVRNGGKVVAMKLQAIGLLAVISSLLIQKPTPALIATLGNSENPAKKDESSKSPPSDVDWEIQNWINDGPGAVQRLVGLGVDQETAAGFVDSFPKDDLHAEWKPVHTESSESSAAMFLPCDGLGSANLYALKKGNKGWHVIDRMGFDCHYDDSVSMEIASIHDPNRDEVLIHHAC
jgi:hypothetical protein